MAFVSLHLKDSGNKVWINADKIKSLEYCPEPGQYTDDRYTRVNLGGLDWYDVQETPEEIAAEVAQALRERGAAGQ